ncbi:hypothetical protein BJ170DRAFT_644236, partial [Xylariales sp. AK1849]
MMLFPATRDFKSCLSDSIGRTKVYLDDRYVHLVWLPCIDKHGHRVGNKLVLSAVSSRVNTEATDFQNALMNGWTRLNWWLEELLYSEKDVSIDLADYIESDFAKNVKNLGPQANDKDGLAAFNQSVKDIDSVQRADINALIKTRQAEQQARAAAAEADARKLTSTSGSTNDQGAGTEQLGAYARYEASLSIVQVMSHLGVNGTSQAAWHACCWSGKADSRWERHGGEQDDGERLAKESRFWRVFCKSTPPCVSLFL